ncbi:conserved hypothetical protein [Xenorhabdus cabanillasii JM26]|uniref:Uncharacterized protein n=1 Tax=Xenorhabdus cabanillasii JM26 TaxID=1427517 RepID=W1JBS3_9GAMM|nr:conserved hypothetical protein [Xenorhabdus cabanillasii JM26]
MSMGDSINSVAQMKNTANENIGKISGETIGKIIRDGIFKPPQMKI